MTPLISLLPEPAYLNWPSSLEGWLGLVAWLGALVVLLYRWQHLNPSWGSRHWLLLVLLLLVVPVTSLFGGVRLPPGPALPPAFRPIEPRAPALMVFIALPWLLAGGILGPWAAAGLAAISGTLIGIWDSHTPFTSLEYALLAAVISAGVRQRYRTRFFSLLRHPALAAGLVSIAYPLLFMVNTLLMTNEPLAIRLDFALTRVGGAMAVVGGQLLIAGVIADAIAYGWPKAWGREEATLPSPAERSLEARVQYTLGALIVAMVVGLVVGDWVVAGNAARQMLQQRLQDTAELGAESIPFFLEAGQNLIQQISMDPELIAADDDQLADRLAGHLRSTPYFRQLYVLDAAGRPVDGFPVRDYASLLATPEEQIGFDLARQGVTFQYYAVPPVEVERAAQISFIAAMRDEQGDLQGILWGRTDLASNPFTKPILTNLDSLTDIGGEGMLLDEEGRILYHPFSNLVMTSYTGQTSDEPIFYDEVAPDGTRSHVYYQPVLGRSWAVVLTVSAQQAQQLALRIAAPLLAVLVTLAGIVFVLMRVGVRVVTRSLQSLAQEASRIAQGDLDQPLKVTGEDEVGRLGWAFEDMRRRLKARIEELNQLLLVSQGVAASLELGSALEPILRSARGSGAQAAYVVLSKEILPDMEEDFPREFQDGTSAGRYEHLHGQILSLTAQQERVVLTNPARVRSLRLGEGQTAPGALLAISLRDERQPFGALWVAYDEPHQFSEEEVKFLVTLAGQAAVAVDNAHLYLSAEIGRQRLEAVLSSTPDPVLVTDHRDRLMLANPASLDVLKEGSYPGEGLPVEEAIALPELVDLLRAGDSEQRSTEVELPGGKTYFATSSVVMAEGKSVGRVCVMQDITHFKHLSEMKSEFVSSVSHDLRSPLTLMRGYATMLPMVGDLNDQQTSYIRKILTAVDGMTRLVVNLLDLGRIEAGIGLKVEKVPILEVIEQVKGALQMQATQKEIDLSMEIPPHATTLIEADPALLHQALHNLVENAIKYTEPKGKVIIRLSERNANIIFEVLDTGIGIAPVDQPRLFERFYRGARREARQQRGSGLGLAIVKSIAERHGGRVWVDSRLGQGSQFFLQLPIEQPGHNPARPAAQEPV